MIMRLALHIFLLVALVPMLANGISAAEPELVPCASCAQSGTKACARCKEGTTRCPATCLKKDDPGWVPGPDGKTVKHFPSRKKGTPGGRWWSIGHCGELIVYEDGMPVNKGRCPTCAGTSVVACKACKGTGAVPCSQCKGSKQISKATADQLEAERAANTITLTGGRTISGKILSRTDDKVIIKTTDGKMEVVDASELVEP